MSKLRGLSLFSNVGVAEVGLEQNDEFSMLYANELDPKRCEFYRHVHPHTEVIEGDLTDDSVRNVIVEKSLSAGVNFILATPPCQGMSEAGCRLEFDERNELIYYAVDVIKRVSPSFVILENVPKMLKTKIHHKNKTITIPEYLISELEDKYIFNEQSLIKAMDYGVPQMRERNIFLLVDREKGIKWNFPRKEKSVTLYEAIGSLPSLDPFLREG